MFIRESLLEARVRRLEDDLAALREEVLSERAQRFSKELVLNEQVQNLSQWLVNMVQAANDNRELPVPPIEVDDAKESESR
jgi:hypothetical protein